MKANARPHVFPAALCLATLVACSSEGSSPAGVEADGSAEAGAQVGGDGGGPSSGGTSSGGTSSGGTSSGGAAGAGPGPDASAAGTAGTASADAGEDARGGPAEDAGPPPIEANLVFVTDDPVPADFGGLAGGDAICNQVAAEAGRPGTYVAWLSVTGTNAIDRLNGARGWVRPDGKPVADTVSDIESGVLYYPPRLTASGEDLSLTVHFLPVWTGTNEDGTLQEGSTCGGWTETEGDARIGIASAGSSMMSQAGSTLCSLTYVRLLCFGVDLDVAVVPEKTSGRLAFSTATAWDPGSGIDAADTLCAVEATVRGIEGSFRALLARDGATAASRFDTDGPPWVRPDGLPLMPTAEALFTTPLLDVPLVLDVAGEYQPSVWLWTGAANLTTPGTAATTCNDWESSAGTDTATGSAEVGVTAFNYLGNWPDQACNVADRHVACLEQ